MDNAFRVNAAILRRLKLTHAILESSDDVLSTLIYSHGWVESIAIKVKYSCVLPVARFAAGLGRIDLFSYNFW